jgi:hypothetical protein
MTQVRRRLISPLLVLALWLLLAGPTDASAFQLFRTEEASIADIQAALLARTLTCRALVQMYLDRIAAYDKQGPALNAIVAINADALKTADALDAQLAQSGPVGPLHCVPIIVKDNYDTVDMPTSAGSLSLKGSMPPRDAFQVRKLREVGAIMLAKANMAEFAFDPFETVGSLLPGYTKNPYALTRVTAGSSGGPPPRWPRTSAPLGWAPTRGTPFVGQPRIRVWSASARRWASRVVTGSYRSFLTRTSAGPWHGR